MKVVKGHMITTLKKEKEDLYNELQAAKAEVSVWSYMCVHV